MNKNAAFNSKVYPEKRQKGKGNSKGDGGGLQWSFVEMEDESKKNVPEYSPFDRVKARTEMREEIKDDYDKDPMGLGAKRAIQNNKKQKL